MSENGHLAHAPFSLSLWTGWSVFSFVSSPFQQEKVLRKMDVSIYRYRYDPVNLKKLLQLLVISFIQSSYYYKENSTSGPKKKKKKKNIVIEMSLRTCLLFF
jgi:hypothetical protein